MHFYDVCSSMTKPTVSISIRCSSANRSFTRASRTATKPPYNATTAREILIGYSAAAEVGFLDVSDPSKVYVVALASEDPLHFRWRVYLPDNHSVIWRTSQWGDGKHSSTGPQNFIAQVRFRKSEYDFVRMFKELESSGGVGSLGGRELETSLRDQSAWPNKAELIALGVDASRTWNP
jgi:hypothetical protein